MTDSEDPTTKPEESLGETDISALGGNDEKECKFCSTPGSKYVCPRCGIRYCSVLCYKHPTHSLCSESFFKQCIEEELSSTPHDSAARKQMMEALQKLHEEGVEDEVLDSDDEEDDLATRLENIDLDNAEAVWSQLTDAERAEFESLVASGEVGSIVPPWTPWWCNEQSPLIEEVTPSSKRSTPDYPPLVANIPLFGVIATVKPSRCIEFNIINVIASYSFTNRHYNGEAEHNAKAAGSCLFQLSDNLSHNSNFSSSELAVQAVVHNAVNILNVSPEDTSLISSDVKDIMSCKQFVLYALSGASHILMAAKQDMKSAKKQIEGGKSSKQSFSTRFPESNSNASTTTDFVLTKSSLNAGVKKLEYYMSWVSSYYTNTSNTSSS